MSTRTSSRPAVASLLDDRRGVIMVIAVFMAAFLVGALWYIIGIGDTILYRERMQDGADAVAYAGAVYHARGMNLIAMINIVMAGLLAVLIAMKLVQVINFIANVISCAIAALCLGVCFPFTSICGLTSNLESPISNAISSYQKFLKPTLKALSTSQKGIALAMPWVAEGKAAYVATKYYNKPVKTGGIISASLVPMPREKLGLPVQDDWYFSILCKKAGQYVGEVILSPFGPFGPWVGGVIGGIAHTFPGYFCNGGGVLDVDFNKSAVGQLCTQRRKKFEHDHQGDKHPPSFEMDKCKKHGQKDLSKDVAKKMGGLKGLAGGMSSDSRMSKKVFEDAENGNGYFQVWSVVIGDDQWPRKADRGVEIAAWGKRLSTPAMPWGKVAFAEAEFYYDTSGKWEDYKEDAMWNMRWRARFRRVRPPTPDVATLLSGAVADKLNDKLGNALGNVFANDDFLSWAVGSTASTKFGRGMREVLKGGGHWVDDKIQSSVLKSYDNLQVIH